MPRKERDYKREWELARRRGEHKDRWPRRQARNQLEKEGVDLTGKEVHHKKPLRSGGTNARSNLAAVPKSINRSDNGQYEGMKKGRRK